MMNLELMDWLLTVYAILFLVVLGKAQPSPVAEVESNRCWSSRLLVRWTIWSCALLLSGWNIVEQVWTNWLYYGSYPMQVVETASQIPLSEFDFPAVTVCSVFKIRYARAEAHVHRVLGANASREDVSSYWNTLIAEALLHFPHFGFPLQFINAFNFTPYPLSNPDIPTIMKEVGHSVDDILDHCYWRGTKYNCSDMFSLQATEEGFCHSFNSWTAQGLDSGFYNDSGGKVRPMRNTAAGKHTGLELFLKPPDLRFYHDFQKHSMGYNIIIHSPWDQPDISWNIQIDKLPVQVQRIFIRPMKYIGDISVKETPKLIRGCNWDPDNGDSIVSDRYFCFIQCRLSATIQTCNCTPYYFQAAPGLDYCEVRHMECLSNLEVKLRNHESNDRDELMENTEDKLICNCVKPCSYVVYETDIMQSTINMPNPSDLYAIVDVSYKDRHGRGFRREVKFTLKDFAVTVGGLASLYLGSSVISLLELFYYLGRLGVLACRSVLERRSPADFPFLP